STRLRAEAPKMLWADLVSTSYLIYRICYVLIGLRILEEEWRGKDTSLAHLKIFGCDSFVKVKDVCGESMKYSIYRARSVTDSSSLMKPIQKSQVVLVNIPENLAKNDSIVAEHGLSSEITQSPGGSSDTSEGSKNSGSFEDSGRSDEEDSEDEASSKEGGSETPQITNKKEGITKLVDVQDSWNKEPCRDVHQVGGEREVEVMRNFNWPLRELIAEDGVLPERGGVTSSYSRFNDSSSRADHAVHIEWDRYEDVVLKCIADTIILKIMGLSLKRTADVEKAASIWGLTVNSNLYYKKMADELLNQSLQ
ncbi:hypothetical protein Tco_0872989, partial [Tanacetum coccineum]